MDITKIFTICLVITVILLVINLLRVESFKVFKDHKTISVNEMNEIKKSVKQNVGTMPSLLTDNDEYEKYLATQISQMKNLYSKSVTPIPSMYLQNNISNVIDDLITEKQKEKDTESDTNSKEQEYSKCNTNLISRVRRVELILEKTDDDKDKNDTNCNVRIKLKGNKYLSVSIEDSKIDNLISAEKDDDNTEFILKTVNNATDYLNLIDKFSNDYIIINPNIEYPFYLITPKDYPTKCLTINVNDNKEFLYIKEILGKKDEQFEINEE